MTAHLSHASDPATSHEAATRHDASGTRQRHLDIIVAAVTAHPGLTAIELLDYVPLDEYQTRRRLTDACRLGLVTQGEGRRCSVRGSRMVVWFAADRETQKELF